jgi:hypothetical protein
MGDASLTKAIVEAADLKSLELLFDYTKFHVGFYIALPTAFITIASLKKGEEFLFDVRPRWLYLSLTLFLIAGVAAGVILSSITQCYASSASQITQACTSTFSFLTQEWGPLGYKPFSGLMWTRIEHLSFWLGVLAAIASFKIGRSAPVGRRSYPARRLRNRG